VPPPRGLFDGSHMAFSQEYGAPAGFGGARRVPQQMRGGRGHGAGFARQLLEDRRVLLSKP
jgi:hypothetical protein